MTAVLESDLTAYQAILQPGEQMIDDIFGDVIITYLYGTVSAKKL